MGEPVRDNHLSKTLGFGKKVAIVVSGKSVSRRTGKLLPNESPRGTERVVNGGEATAMARGGPTTCTRTWRAFEVLFFDENAINVGHKERWKTIIGRDLKR